MQINTVAHMPEKVQRFLGGSKSPPPHQSINFPGIFNVSQYNNNSIAVKNLMNSQSNPQGQIPQGNPTYQSPMATINQQERFYSLKPTERTDKYASNMKNSASKHPSSHNIQDNKKQVTFRNMGYAEPGQQMATGTNQSYLEQHSSQKIPTKQGNGDSSSKLFSNKKLQGMQ